MPIDRSYVARVFTKDLEENGYVDIVLYKDDSMIMRTRFYPDGKETRGAGNTENSSYERKSVGNGLGGAHDKLEEAMKDRAFDKSQYRDLMRMRDEHGSLEDIPEGKLSNFLMDCGI